MDRSGSMTTREEIHRQELFSLAGAPLRPQISDRGHGVHRPRPEAQIVPEQDFFTISNSGGTNVFLPLSRALEHIQKTHRSRKWDNYVFHFSAWDWEEE